MATRIMEYFADLPDPRRQAGRRHFLGDILAIAICAVICGADEFSAIAEFGRAKVKWFKKSLRLPHGIPSEDTFRRVFTALKPEAFERCFMAWVKALAGSSKGGQIAIDGKSLRGSFDRAGNKAAIHMVSAWASANELCFGQLATDAKSNEITTIPKLLELLDLNGATVTIDAMGCQTRIANQIIDMGGEYVLALKGNQGTLHEEVKLFLDDAIGNDFKGIEHGFDEQTDGDHGRIEVRRTWSTSSVAWFEDRAQWAGLRSFAAVECERTVADKTSCERRYFISSLDGRDAEALAKAVRAHWQIENGLHWSLDVGFAEDKSRVRRGHAAENLSRVRRMALNLLKQETTSKRGIKTKRMRAGWDDAYLIRVLQI